MRKLVLTPSQSGYSADLGQEVLSVGLSGGPSRRRRDFLGAVAMVNVGWNLPQQGFDYLEAFYRSATLNGSEPFLIDLVIDGWLPTEYQATFVPGSYRITSVAGFQTSVSAQLEVQPLPANATTDESLMLVYESYGEGGDLLLSTLADLVNVELPVIL